jgi:Ca2+/Na+ antiporter
MPPFKYDHRFDYPSEPMLRPRRSGSGVPPHFPSRYPAHPAARISSPRAHTSGGVSARGLLFLLGFIATSFLIVALWPYRVLILHLFLGLLALLVLVIWLILMLKVRRWRNARRAVQQRQPKPLLYHLPEEGYSAHVHDASPWDYQARTSGSTTMPAPPYLLSPYDYPPTNGKRPSEHLKPDQRSRF